MIEHRLIQSTHPTPPTEQFSYDPVGNRLGTVVDAGNRLLEDTNYTYSYDNNGNIIQKTKKATGEVTTYTYDSENRLIQVLWPGTTASYKYDPFGRRIEKNVNGILTKYLYDEEDILVEYDGNNQPVARYTHGPDIDEPISVDKGGQSYFYHFDGLGSVTGMTDINGAIVQEYEYDSFGNITYIQDQNFVQPYTYTSREYDPESGLYYFRARYYDAKVGRFISEDPIGLAGGDVNLYSYVWQNPLNWTDSTGLSRDKYVPDRDKHGGKHVDRYTPEGKKVGRYRPDGTPMEHKGKCPPPIPKKDLQKFLKAVKKLGLIGLGVTILNLGFDIHESGAQKAVGNMVGDMVDNIVNPFFGASEAEAPEGP